MNRSTSENRGLITAPGIIIADMTLSTIAILLGFLGNAGVCFLLRKRSDLRKVPHYLLASLAVNGVFSCLLNLPSRLAMIVMVHLLDIPVSAEVACHILVPSSFACSILNAVTLSLMAIDRQDCVLRPFNRRMSKRNITKVIAISWIGTSVLTSAIIVYTFFRESEECDIISKIEGSDPIYVYLSILTVSFNVVCVLIIVIAALRIVKRLRSSPLPEARSQHRRQENKLTWLTYKICGVFLVCWLPLFVCFPLAQFGRNSDDILVGALIITLAVSNFNYVVNPFLYYKMLKQRPVNIPKVAVVVARDREMNSSTTCQQ
ncbi:neuropeptide Y receptor type 2-like [Orbicella faveolata]|uniref:neuropeptide Y receptor type 2-like n=1 Tax=Orbicella faveolata TaxID=48498 RepID=UPI0009E4DFDA|nr:neuropeptide Y receptor type 2-like [Orbicella faveolata]